MKLSRLFAVDCQGRLITRVSNYVITNLVWLPGGLNGDKGQVWFQAKKGGAK